MSPRKDVPCAHSVTGNVLALEGGWCQGQGQRHEGEKTLRRAQQYMRDLSELFHLLRAPQILQVTSQTSWSISAAFGLWVGNEFEFLSKKIPEFFWERAEPHGGGALASKF